MTEAPAPPAGNAAAAAAEASASPADSAAPATGGSTDPDAGLRRLAAGTFRLAHLRDGQLAGMRALAQGRDVLAVMPTGYGKSAIYQVAALHLHRVAREDSNGGPGAGGRFLGVVATPVG